MTYEIQIYENELSDLMKTSGVRPTYDILCEAIEFKL